MQKQFLLKQGILPQLYDPWLQMTGIQDGKGCQKGEIQKRKIVETEIFSVDIYIKILVECSQF